MSPHIALVYRKGGKWICSGHGPWKPKVTPNPNSIEEHFQSGPVEERQLLHIVRMSNIQELALGLRKGEIVIVSNGSYKDELGAAAVIMRGMLTACELI